VGGQLRLALKMLKIAKSAQYAFSLGLGQERFLPLLF
jgi:hypothetical protein